MEEGTPATAPAGTEEAAPATAPERKPFRLTKENARGALNHLRLLAADARGESMTTGNGERYRDLIVEEAELMEDCTAHVLELIASEAAVIELARKVPTTIGEALAQLYMSRHAANLAAKLASAAHHEWAAMDLLSPRLREECVAELMVGGMAATPAKTAASAHPRYTAHRDMVANLETARNEAALDAAVTERDFAAAYASAELVASMGRSAAMGFVLAAPERPPDPEQQRFTGEW